MTQMDINRVDHLAARDTESLRTSGTKAFPNVRYFIVSIIFFSLPPPPGLRISVSGGRVFTVTL
jgi:hypothetical protein